MANVKISELTALTTPADADALVIVDDSEASLEKTKQITYANLKAALTGAGATYGTTGAYTASMPTNGVAASSIVMLGTSSTIIWMYLNAAPPGWKALSTGADTVLGVSGGSGYYNVNGGNPDSLASWTLSGLTMAHTHTTAGHTHTLALGGGNLAFSNTLSGQSPGGTGYYYVVSTTSVYGTIPSSGDLATGAASTSSVSSSGAWRPKASVGKLFQLDTA
jgi:hypothetical protein